MKEKDRPIYHKFDLQLYSSNKSYFKKNNYIKIVESNIVDPVTITELPNELAFEELAARLLKTQNREGTLNKLEEMKGNPLLADKVCLLLAHFHCSKKHKESNPLLFPSLMINI